MAKTTPKTPLATTTHRSATLSMYLFAALSVAQVAAGLTIDWEQDQPTPLISIVIGATLYSAGLVCVCWLASCVWRARKTGWALGVIGFYVVSYAFSIGLECAAGGDWGPAWFVALRASLVLTLLTSAVLLVMALAEEKRARVPRVSNPGN